MKNRKFGLVEEQDGDILIKWTSRDLALIEVACKALAQEWEFLVERGYKPKEFNAEDDGLRLRRIALQVLLANRPVTRRTTAEGAP